VQRRGVIGATSCTSTLFWPGKPNLITDANRDPKQPMFHSV
jgi:hypothetical protein